MPGRQRTRRGILATTGIALGMAGLAGCSGIRPGTEPGETGTATATSTSTSTSTSTATDRADDSTTATESPTTDTPSADRKERVQFQSTANTQVVGTVYGAPGSTCGIVMVPQINLDRESWQPQAEQLAGMGHVALPIDEDTNNRAESAQGAVSHLRGTENVERVILVGASSGGEAVVKANARAESGAVHGLVTLSAAGGTDFAGELTGRKLFVVSENDDDRFVRITRELHENAPEPKARKIYSGSAHGQGIFDTKHGDDLANRLFTLVEDVCK